jgi:hypothetical protein
MDSKGRFQSCENIKLNESISNEKSSERVNLYQLFKGNFDVCNFVFIANTIQGYTLSISRISRKAGNLCKPSEVY